ncbi:hypothetical protein T484DRAFT_1642117 [Baffinella frigidus]|nr:hypothetical protein T484DRAFT_1642117 [Cryptophyta sp. CCMP2293]
MRGTNNSALCVPSTGTHRVAPYPTFLPSYLPGSPTFLPSFLPTYLPTWLARNQGHAPL